MGGLEIVRLIGATEVDVISVITENSLLREKDNSKNNDNSVTEGLQGRCSVAKSFILTISGL